MDCSKTSGIGGLPPGQPLPQKNIDPNRSQSRGIKEIASLGQALTQLKKPPKQVRFKGDLGAKSPAKKAQDHHT
jgi:hypothetical protein